MSPVRTRRHGVAALAALALSVGGLAAWPGTAAASTPLPIATIQSTATATPYAGQLVTTTPSEVTALYPADGLAGFVIQTPGTGGKRNLRQASDAIFVYTGARPADVKIGELVTVTATAQEYPNSTDPGVESLTELGGQVTVTKSDASFIPVRPVTGISWARTSRFRENLESMLFADTESFTVTDSHNLGAYGELGLAAGHGPLVQPTDVAPFGSARAQAQTRLNRARAVVLDDGSSARFTDTKAPGTPPYLTPDHDVRLGDTARLKDPVIVDYRNGEWKFNPTAPTRAGDEVATITNRPPEAAPRVGGAISVASFNVLNYFTTVGSGRPGCRPGPLSTDGTANVTYSCDVRGAWDADDLARQQIKIVGAINDLDASVVGLMEIENSAKLGEPTDEATATLVAALNGAAGREKWAYIPSATAQLQPVADQDVITSALIYQPDQATWAGQAYADGADAGPGGAFNDARTPIAAVFSPTRGGAPTVVAVNHFKSKGSAPRDPADPNADHGQGAWNVARVAQAKALAAWVSGVKSGSGSQDVALLGDFNSYTHEDPLLALEQAGYTNAASQNDYSYSFDGLAGSLDHVLLNASARRRETRSAVWNINSIEPTLREYSQYRLTAVDYYRPTIFRASDHDPVVVGLRR